jgi:hypothetical protein
MPQSIRRCLCGWPCKSSLQIRAGRTPNLEIRSFLDSLDMAIAAITSDEGKFAEIDEKLRVIVTVLDLSEEQAVLARPGKRTGDRSGRRRWCSSWFPQEQ